MRYNVDHFSKRNFFNLLKNKVAVVPHPFFPSFDGD
jgi:hypothetical protein